MTSKKETLENIEDKLKTLIRQRDGAILEANNLQKQVIEMKEKFNELSPDYVKITCLTCGGEGFIEGEDGKKTICKNPVAPSLGCGGKGYLWMRKHEENKK